MLTAAKKELWINDSSTKTIKSREEFLEGYVASPRPAERELFNNTLSPRFLTFDNDRSEFFRELLFEIVSRRVIRRNRRLLLELSKY